MNRPFKKQIDSIIVNDDKHIITGGKQELWWNTHHEELDPDTPIRTRRRQNAGLPSRQHLGGVDEIYKIIKTYSLKGFEFGRWMEQDSREDSAVACKASLEQLASIIGSKNIGIDANVGIAFGARGMGKALAHYEPLENMINITKRRGDGSLAHEYGHALDFNLGSYIDQNSRFAALSGGSSVAVSLKENEGAQLRAIVNKIIDQIKQSSSYARIEEWDAYWHRRTEVFARFFEQLISYKLKEKGSQNLYLCKNWQRYKVGTQYLSEADFKKLLPDAEKMLKLMGSALNSKLSLKKTPYPTPKAAAKKKDTKEPKPKAEPKDSLSNINTLHEKFKKNYPDAIIAFRFNDGYAFIKDDAKKVGAVIGNALSPIPPHSVSEAAWFPYDQLEIWLPKLIRSGLRVAICDTKTASSKLAPNSKAQKFAPKKTTKKAAPKSKTNAKQKAAPKPKVKKQPK